MPDSNYTSSDGLVFSSIENKDLYESQNEKVKYLIRLFIQLDFEFEDIVDFSIFIYEKKNSVIEILTED